MITSIHSLDYSYQTIDKTLINIFSYQELGIMCTRREGNIRDLRFIFIVSHIAKYRVVPRRVDTRVGHYQ